MALPAGNYSLNAKFEVEFTNPGDNNVKVTCTLYVNYADNLSGAIDQDVGYFAYTDANVYADVWSLEGTVYYTKPGWAVVACEMAPETYTGDPSGTASNAVLMASAVGAIN